MRPFQLQHARDLSVPLLDRTNDVRRERTHLDSLIQPVFGTLLRYWMSAFHRLTITGAEHPPNKPPFIMIANHASHIDTPALMSALSDEARTAAFPLAAHDTFFTTPARAVLATKLVNALPVRRGHADRHALATLRARLIEDRAVIIIYPEGKRNDGRSILPFMPGIGLLVAGTDVPVVPCRLRGCQYALPKGRWLPRPKRIRLNIGRPVSFAHCANRRDDWQQIADQLYKEVDSL